jgi:hypothetical protein
MTQPPHQTTRITPPDSDTFRRLTYSWCPTCQLITPPSIERRPRCADDPDQTVALCCARCGDMHVVTQPSDLHTELNAEVIHEACGATVVCPSIADVVRCTTRRPGNTAELGCGALIRGPGRRQPPRSSE